LGLRPAAVGVCTFWHSILGVAENRAVTPIYMWSDTRPVEEVAELRRRLDEREVHARTGCMQHTSYVPPKLLWVARHRPEQLEAAQRWMSPGEYLFLRLFGQAHCSLSMASATGMLNQQSLDWDELVLQALPVRRE